MWPFKKKTLSYIPPFSYLALFNTVIDVAKKNGKYYKFVELIKYVYLIYCFYAAKFHKKLLTESFYMYMPMIPLTKSIYKFYINNDIGLESYIKSHFNEEIIDKNCEDYRRIEEIYKYLKQYTLIELIGLMTTLTLDNGVHCPIKQLLYINNCEDYYKSNFTTDDISKVYEKLGNICPKILYTDIELFYSLFIDENGDFIKINFNYETKN